MNPVIERIEQKRIEKGITKTHVAKHCERSVSWYKDISKGRRRVYLEDVFLIAEAIGETPKKFF
ncbi:hypothetical protein SD71_10575 [Cohnella kolymensis]|uniref:HTH cro/C1-type domain-containing protein n=1 Tax=Cohnella kolymensis TaxID=1590652 RepID=A0ABR5A459_9BACL|nr:helix-turn-helix transcriptional regulator [Cohnella kolymensis]KIL35836.1 hypothetical protein SD71_10575 [Cohnella kolymensis]